MLTSFLLLATSFLLLSMLARFCGIFPRACIFASAFVQRTSFASLACSSAFRPHQNRNNLLGLKLRIMVSTSSLEDKGRSDRDMAFGPFKISSDHIFFRSSLSFAFVNLRPIVPGHVLVSSNRVVPRLSELTQEEYVDLWLSVRIVQDLLKKHYNCEAFNIAVQDGQAAGQSVNHVHVHCLPRIAGDFERNDDIYNDIQEWAPRDEFKVKLPKLDVPDDEERKDRTIQQMAEEAAIYRNLIPKL
jgi:bis(5'-adenosyl)-triphosphatase